MQKFRTQPNIQELNKWSENTLSQSLGIEFTSYGDNWLEARMPVDHRTVQPMGLLHGGASVALAETLGSVASVLCLSQNSNLMPVGLEINANHLKATRTGFVIGRVEPVRIGKQIHVWNIQIKNEKGDLTCVSRLTVALTPKINPS